MFLILQTNYAFHVYKRRRVALLFVHVVLSGSRILSELFESPPFRMSDQGFHENAFMAIHLFELF